MFIDTLLYNRVSYLSPVLGEPFWCLFTVHAVRYKSKSSIARVAVANTCTYGTTSTIPARARAPDTGWPAPAAPGDPTPLVAITPQ
jgi:hypothetical protein